MVGKALSLLVLLGDEPRGASAAEISRRAELPFSTTYRLLETLVRQRPAIVTRQALSDYLYPHGEATILSVRDGHHHLTVNKVDGPQTFRVTSDPGHLGALHATAVGKALVAFAEDAEREALIEELDLAPLTEHTITDRAAFRAEMERARRQGYAVMDEENENGMRAVAVPLLNSQGHAFASLATAVPVFRLSMEGLLAHVPLLQEAAAELAARLPQR